jgi:CheY-like chemotaxis protein
LGDDRRWREAGLRALKHEQFVLMIIDIFMPHMRGFESIRQRGLAGGYCELRDCLPQTRVACIAPAAGIVGRAGDAGC